MKHTLKPRLGVVRAVGVAAAVVMCTLATGCAGVRDLLSYEADRSGDRRGGEYLRTYDGRGDHGPAYDRAYGGGYDER